jgi:hypothetical protein
MSYFDYHVSRILAHEGAGDRQRRSEAEYRLYWRTVARQVTPPRRNSQVWLRLRRLLGELRRWWPERVPSDMRVGEEESRTHPLISEQG